MINREKWINSLPKIKSSSDEKINQIDNNKWTNTISKKNTYNSVKKYSLMTVLFVCGLLLVSVIKNKTRILEKEINNLEASINIIKFNLDQAFLDNEVITSPENISKLAEEYLNINLVTYKKSQIKKLDKPNKKMSNLNKKKKENNKIKNLPESVKLQVAKSIEKKKTEIRKLKELYSNPKSIPEEVKTQVAKQIKEKKIELRQIYNYPNEVFTYERVRNWGAVQVVKVFLGIPVVPGR